MLRWTLSELYTWTMSRLKSELDSLRADIREWRNEPMWEGKNECMRQAYEEERLLIEAIEYVSISDEKEKTAIRDETNNRKKKETDYESVKKYATNELPKSKFEISQEKARSAEERFRLNDFQGATQLINEAIALESSYTDFYRQRVKYLTYLGKKEQAIADLRFLLKTNKTAFNDLDKKVKTGALHEFIALHSDVEDLLAEIKYDARKTAFQAKSQAEAEIKNLLSIFSENSPPDFVKEVEHEFQRIIKLVENDSSFDFDLLNVPQLAEEAKSKAAEAIRRKNDMEKQANDSLSQAVQKLDVVFSSQVQKIASNEIHVAQDYLNQAKQLFQARSYANFLKSIEFSERAIQEIQKVEQLLTEHRQPFEQQLREKENVLNKKLSAIYDKYSKKISHQEELRRRSESKLSECEHKKPGGGLLIISFLVGVCLVAISREIASLKEITRSITKNEVGMIFFVILVIMVPYGILRLLIYSGPKMSVERNLQSAKNRIKELTKRKEKEMETLRRGFENDSEILELRQKIRSLQM